VALRFIDGFDHYYASHVLHKWSMVTGTASAGYTVSVVGRFGGGCLRVSGQNVYVTKLLDAQSSWVVGFAYWLSAYTTLTSVFPIGIMDAGTTQMALGIAMDGKLGLYRSATVTFVSASSQSLGLNAWHYLEWLYTISTAVCAGQCVLKVDGVTWIDLASGTNTRGTTGATANAVRIGTIGPSDFLPAAIDDLYIADRTGAGISTFLGDVRVETVFPVRDGTNGAWSAVGGTSHVSTLYSAFPNSSTDYVTTSAVNAIDAYQFSAVSANSALGVFAVQLCLNAQKTDAGVREIAAFVSASGTASVGVSQMLLVGFGYYLGLFTSNPAGGVSWAISTVSAAEWGVKLVG
jgi:hypothetical protein